MQRWRVLDCSKMQGRLRAQRGAIEILRDKEEPAVVPVADVSVVLVGVSVSFSTAVIHRLLREDIAVIFCDWKGVPEGAAYSNQEHCRVGARHLAQVRLSLPRKKNAWGRIVKAKVLGQANVLKEHGLVEAHDLNALAHDVCSGDPTNIEARAAKIYWQALASSKEFRRRPGKGTEKGGSSNRNAHLDYAYTILRGHGIRAVMAAGLSPTLGVYHRGRSNYFSLVDDLMEPYRPAIDSAVFELENDAQIEEGNVRRHLVEAASRVFSTDGLHIPSSFSSLAQQYGRYVEGEVSRLDITPWQGPF